MIDTARHPQEPPAWQRIEKPTDGPRRSRRREHEGGTGTVPQDLIPELRAMLTVFHRQLADPDVDVVAENETCAARSVCSQSDDGVPGVLRVGRYPERVCVLLGQRTQSRGCLLYTSDAADE